MEVWTPVVIRHFGEFFEKNVAERYEVSNLCRIRKRKNKLISKSNHEKFKFTDGRLVKGLRVHRVCLASFYPEKIPENIEQYHVDHIDGDHSNQNLNNLQWLEHLSLGTKQENAQSYHNNK